MKKTVLLIFTTGVLLAQTNNINGNTINTNGGNVHFEQSNDNVSKEEILIDRKIDNALLEVLSSNQNQQTKNMLINTLHESKNINKQKIPYIEKNRQCKYKAELGAKILKFANVKLLLSYCDDIF